MTSRTLTVRVGKIEKKVKPTTKYNGYLVHWVTRSGKGHTEGPFRTLQIAANYIEEHIQKNKVFEVEIYHINKTWKVWSFHDGKRRRKK